MELQMTFAELEYDSKKRRTRREIFEAWEHARRVHSY